MMQETKDFIVTTVITGLTSFALMGVGCYVGYRKGCSTGYNKAFRDEYDIVHTLETNYPDRTCVAHAVDKNRIDYEMKQLVVPENTNV